MVATFLALATLLTATQDARDSMPRVESDSVLVSFEVNAGYDDSPRSLEELSQLLEVLPPAIVVVREGEDVPSLLLRLYTISDDQDDGRDFQSRLPATYRLLYDYIIDANELVPGTSIHAGDSLFVPALPPLASPGDPENPYNALPIVRRLRVARHRFDADSANPLESIVLLPDATDSLRTGLGKGQQRIRLEFWVGRADGEALQTQFGPALRGRFNLRISAERWRAAFSPGTRDSIDAPSAAFTSRDSAALARALSAPGPGYGILLVLDSGWPNRAAAEQSVQTLRALFDVARARWRITGGPSRTQLPAVLAPPRNDHVVRIYEALRSLEALDPNDRVKVVYVPSTREQNGGTVLEELLYIEAIMEFKRAAARSGIAKTPERMALDPRYVHSARKAAEAKVRSLPAFTPPDGFAIDGDIVQALLDVVNTAAEAQRRAVVYSASWVIQQNVVSLALPSPLWGVAVVAVGNENGRNIFATPPVDFAQRTAAGRQFMAVETMDETGPRCGTSEAHSSGLDDMLIAGYNGWLPSMQWDCGSSFATPRVAWFIAAAEALRDGDVNGHLYGRELLEKLRAMRRARGADTKTRLLFSPGMLLPN